MEKASYKICEYGLIRSKADYYKPIDVPLKEIYLPNSHFNSLYDFILSNQEESENVEKTFTLFNKGKKRQIKVKNYVGVIETQERLHLEILPKIHLNKSSDELTETKKIFLKMLRHLKNSPFINISTAQLETTKHFPILEVFIKSYISEVENNLKYGIKHDYLFRSENVSFLKGKLKVADNIKKNYYDKSHFYCEFTDYSPDIPLNRIIKSTLLKLLKISNNYQNIYSINKILSHFEDIQPSKNYKTDLSKVNISNKLFLKFKTIIEWSEVFLINKSFTNFKGDNRNLAILFPMQKIFEDYLGYLFRKYSQTQVIRLQDKSYFLVEHKKQKRFGLKPDIVIGDENKTRMIIDAKWKLLNNFSVRGNYNISHADMYQLYAYGKKYNIHSEKTGLIMIYPSNPNFTSKLDPFIYEEFLKLEVIPFNLIEDAKQQVENILGL